MPTKIDMPLPPPQLEPSRKAGDVEPFPSGRITYLAPLPLPTPLPPHGPHTVSYTHLTLPTSDLV